MNDKSWGIGIKEKIRIDLASYYGLKPDDFKGQPVKDTLINAEYDGVTVEWEKIPAPVLEEQL